MSQIPRISTKLNTLSEEEVKNLQDMIEGSKNTIGDLNHLHQVIFDEADNSLKLFYSQLDIEAKGAIKRSKKKIRGKLTPEKVAKAGFRVVYTYENDAYIEQNGKRVSRIVRFPRANFDWGMGLTIKETV